MILVNLWLKYLLFYFLSIFNYYHLNIGMFPCFSKILISKQRSPLSSPFSIVISSLVNPNLKLSKFFEYSYLIVDFGIITWPLCRLQARITCASVLQYFFAILTTSLFFMSVLSNILGIEPAVPGAPNGAAATGCMPTLFNHSTN